MATHRSTAARHRPPLVKVDVKLGRARPARHRRRGGSAVWRAMARRARARTRRIAKAATKNWREHYKSETVGAAARMRRDLERQLNRETARQPQQTPRPRPAQTRPAATTRRRPLMATETTAAGRAMLPEGRAITKAGAAMATWLPAEARDTYDQLLTITRALAALGGQLTVHAETLARLGVDRRVLDLVFAGSTGVAQCSAPYVQAVRKFAELYRGDLLQSESPAHRVTYPKAA
jgi:hypothetical protein